MRGASSTRARLRGGDDPRSHPATARRGRGDQALSSCRLVAVRAPTALQTLGDVTPVAIPLLPAEALQTPRSDLLLLSQSGSDLTERTRERARRD